MMSGDHSLLENHQKQHISHTRATCVFHTTLKKQERQRVDKWLSTFLPPPPPAATSSKLSHPFALKQTHQPTASTTHTRCKCTPNLTRGQIQSPRNKNTETKTQYNFSQTYPNRRRKRPSCPKHIDQSDKHRRQPQFKRQPYEPINNTRNPSTIPRASSKQDEIDKMAKRKPRIKLTNENPRIKTGPANTSSNQSKGFPSQISDKLPGQPKRASTPEQNEITQ
jgi:hypothetical protein